MQTSATSECAYTDAGACPNRRVKSAAWSRSRSANKPQHFARRSLYNHAGLLSFCCCRRRLKFERNAFATPTREPGESRKKTSRISGVERDLEAAELVSVKTWLPYPGDAGTSPGSPPVVRSGLHHYRRPREFETPGKLLHPIIAQAPLP